MISTQEILDFLAKYNFNETKLTYPGHYTTQIYYSKDYYIRINFKYNEISLFYQKDLTLRNSFNISDDQLEYFKFKML